MTFPSNILGDKIWNIDINFVVFKNKYKNKLENVCQIKFGILVTKYTKIIDNHARISSTDQQVRVREKNIRNGINIEINVNIPELFALSI